MSSLPICLGKSRATKYVLEDDKVRLPYASLKGVVNRPPSRWKKRRNRADTSVEELQNMSGVSSAVMETLRQAGALGDLPDSNQLSFF